MADGRERRLDEIRQASDEARRRATGADLPDESLPDTVPAPSRRPKGLTGTQYESWLDRQIRQAQEQGLFDNLRGHGQPLAPDDQNVRAYAGDDAMGLKILKDNDALPAWIELNREIAAMRAQCAKVLDAYVAAPEKARRERLATDYRRLVAELNAKIDQYNMSVPARSLEQIRLRVELELRDADQRRWAALDR